MSGPDVSTSQTHELDDYLDAVTSRLGAIPDRDDVVEELRGHLEEVCAEHPGLSLRQILGDAAAYADELRASAGLPPHRASRRGFRKAWSRIVAASRTHAPRFVQDLRAFWWGIRGLALGLFAYVFWHALGDAIRQHDYIGNWDYRLSAESAFDAVVNAWVQAPQLTLLTALLVVGVIVSVWTGGMQARGHGPRWLATLTGVVGALLGLWFAFVLWDVLTTAVFATRQDQIGL